MRRGVGLALWMLAMLAVLQVARLPLDEYAPACGIWGCYPPLGPLIAMHGFWLVLALGLAWGLRRLGCGRRIATGIAVLALVLGCGMIIRDVIRWFDAVPDDEHYHWPRRVGYIVATSIHLPFVQMAVAAGLVLGSQSSRTVRDHSSQNSISFDAPTS